MLIELFEVLPQLNTAVETTAGNSLFHVVVETDEVATRLTELLNKGKCGRASFMPLNRLKVRGAAAGAMDTRRAHFGRRRGLER